MNRIERVVVAGHRLPLAEAEILRVLLRSEQPLLVSEVRVELGRRQAHTTVVTLLGRLLERGLVVRQGDARGHRYSAAGSEVDLAVAALEAVLSGVDDPAAALVAFINQLPSSTKRGVTQALKDRIGRGK